MKFEAPRGSVFGGYGFWTYSSTPDLQPSAGNRHPRAPEPTARSSLSLRAVAQGASRLLTRWTR